MLQIFSKRDEGTFFLIIKKSPKFPFNSIFDLSILYTLCYSRGISKRFHSLEYIYIGIYIFGEEKSFKSFRLTVALTSTLTLILLAKISVFSFPFECRCSVSCLRLVAVAGFSLASWEMVKNKFESVTREK